MGLDDDVETAGADEAAGVGMLAFGWKAGRTKNCKNFLLCAWERKAKGSHDLCYADSC